MKSTPRHHVRHGALALVALALAATCVAGCGKASPAAKPAATTAPTHAQLVAKADAICAKTASTIAPLLAQLATIQKVRANSERTRLRMGPLIEEIAGGNRLDARELMEIPIQNSEEHSHLQNAAYTVLELSVMEEQLAQGFRTNEPSRIRAIAPDIEHSRAHAREQAREFGLKTCAQTPQVQIP